MKLANPTSLIVIGALVSSAGALASAGEHAGHAGHAGHEQIATTELKAADGAAKGKAWIAAHDGRWELKVEVMGLAAGTHGAHLHTVGKCDGPDFASAGGHLNPQGKMHGSENPQGAHMGDLPNLTVDAAGKGSLTAPLTGTAAELGAALFDADGTAVVIHASADDYRTDPSGNSGGRIACGVLQRIR